MKKSEKIVGTIFSLWKLNIKRAISKSIRSENLIICNDLKRGLEGESNLAKLIMRRAFFCKLLIRDNVVL